MLDRDYFLFSQEITSLIIPKNKVATVEPDWTLERALIRLTRTGYSSIPVINSSNEVEGLIGKNHILDFMYGQNRVDFAELAHYKVREAMDNNHSGILSNSLFSFAFEVLIHHSYIPIIDLGNQFLGILTRKVMMEEVIKYFQEEFNRSAVR